MSTRNATLAPGQHPDRDTDTPAIIVALETLTELADLLLHHRVAIAALQSSGNGAARRVGSVSVAVP